MKRWSIWLSLATLFATYLLAGGVELTFELDDNAKECFYQEIEKNVSSTLEFQVSLSRAPVSRSRLTRRREHVASRDASSPARDALHFVARIGADPRSPQLHSLALPALVTKTIFYLYLGLSRKEAANGKRGTSRGTSSSPSES